MAATGHTTASRTFAKRFDHSWSSPQWIWRTVPSSATRVDSRVLEISNPNGACDTLFRDAATDALRAFNQRLSNDPRLITSILPLGDGTGVSVVV